MNYKFIHKSIYGSDSHGTGPCNMHVHVCESGALQILTRFLLSSKCVVTIPPAKMHHTNSVGYIYIKALVYLHYFSLQVSPFLDLSLARAQYLEELIKPAKIARHFALKDRFNCNIYRYVFFFFLLSTRGCYTFS